MAALDELHLIHHTHTDFGYTDLPETTLRMHVEYIGQALRLASRFRRYPEEARFRWNLESLLPVEGFLARAEARDRKTLFWCLDNGLMELTAMPCQITPCVGKAEMVEFYRRMRPLFRRFRPKVAFQNDINGFPWGLLPLLREQGIETLWMGINTYAAKLPAAAPSFRWWNGPQNARVLVYLAPHYCEGYFWFHREEWRRGPVPSSTNPWFHAPDPGQIWNRSRTGLREAFAIFQAKQEALLRTGYSLPVLGLQVTNLWRMDNDPPFAGLPDFVRAWNDAGFTPRLRISTCSQFLAEVKKTGADFPAYHGDWQDWWVDGLVSTPSELAALQKAQRHFRDLEGAARSLRVSLGERERDAISDLATNLILGSEHTWGGYASYARPYDPLSAGANAQKRGKIFQCHEDSLALRAGIIRKSRHYCHSSRTKTLAVCNPGETLRSGWVEIDASALRFRADTARCQETGELFPLEDLHGPEWAPAGNDVPETVFEYPENIWAMSTRTRRFFLGNVAAGKVRRFDLLELGIKKKAARRRSPISFTMDPSRGLPKSISLGRLGFLDPGAPHSFGALLIETTPNSVDVRGRVAERRGTFDWTHRSPGLRACHHPHSFYAERYLTVWTDPIAHRIEQQWDICFGQPRIELTTTLWLKDCVEAMAIYLSFPFKIPGAVAAYDSLGCLTRFGKDQMPGTCGEYAAVGNGVRWTSARKAISLSSPDAPLGCIESPAARHGRTAFQPKNQRFYSLIANNHWITNFPFLQATKLTVRHILEVGPAGDCEAMNGELWAFPASATSVFGD